MALLERCCYGQRNNRLRSGIGQEKAMYGVPSAPEGAPFERREESVSSPPPLKEKSEGRGAYSVRSSDVSVWHVFYRLPSYDCLHERINCVLRRLHVFGLI